MPGKQVNENITWMPRVLDLEHGIVGGGQKKAWVPGWQGNTSKSWKCFD